MRNGLALRGFAESGETDTGRVGGHFFEDGGEDGEAGTLGLGATNVVDGMAGDGDEKVSGFKRGTPCGVRDNGTDVRGRDIGGREMNAIGTGGESDIGA